MIARIEVVSAVVGTVAVLEAEADLVAEAASVATGVVFVVDLGAADSEARSALW